MIGRLHRILDDPDTQRVLRRLFFVLTAFTLFMALTPHPPTFEGEPGDKIQHMAAFATLAGIASTAWRAPRWWAIFLALAGLGGFIEIAQAIPVLHRDSEWMDWIADMAATLASLALVRGLVLRRR